MSDSVTLIQPRRLRAPREDGSALIDPPFGDAIAWLHASVESRSAQNTDLGGRALADLAADARALMLDAAVQHTAAYRDIARLRTSNQQVPIIMVGHQPELVHPGVWFRILSCPNWRTTPTASRFTCCAITTICARHRFECRPARRKNHGLFPFRLIGAAVWLLTSITKSRIANNFARSGNASQRRSNHSFVTH